MMKGTLQDKGASSSMEAAMDLMQLNGIIRRAINLVTGAQIHVDETMFEFAVTSIIPGFKVNSRTHRPMTHAACTLVMSSHSEFRGVHDSELCSHRSMATASSGVLPGKHVMFSSRPASAG